jgi:hypothetical protein
MVTVTVKINGVDTLFAENIIILYYIIKCEIFCCSGDTDLKVIKEFQNLAPGIVMI